MNTTEGSVPCAHAMQDALCAFCLHSDAARRFFVTNGGLEALLVASKSTNEKTVGLP